MGLSDPHKQLARKYFSERAPNTWNRGRFLVYCRSSTALSEAQIGNAYRMALHEMKMGGAKQQADRARELLLEEKRRLERLNHKQQKKQDTIVQVGNFVAGSVQGGSLTATGHTAIQKQKYVGSSPVPDFAGLDGISSDSDMPPTEILSSYPNSTQSGDEVLHPKTSPKLSSRPCLSLYPVDSGVSAPEANAAVNAIQTKATQTKVTRTSGTQTCGTQTSGTRADTPEIKQGEGRQDRLCIEILKLDVEFLKRRNAMLEERIDDLMNTIAVVQGRVRGR